jgi:hypothetical protein
MSMICLNLNHRSGRPISRLRKHGRALVSGCRFYNLASIAKYVPNWYAEREGPHGRPCIQGWESQGSSIDSGAAKRGGASGGAEPLAQGNESVRSGQFLAARGTQRNHDARGRLWDSIANGRGKRMECQFAFICDFAEQDGKLHAIGIGWDAIFAPQLPLPENYVLKSFNQISDWHIFGRAERTSDTAYCGYQARGTEAQWPSPANNRPEQHKMCAKCLAAASPETRADFAP